MANELPSRDGFDTDVYPMHILDSASVNHCFVSFIMRFNDVLDPKKLSDSLGRLLEKGDWRKLGGRLRVKKGGGLEIHSPKAFSADVPAFTYTHYDLNTESIDKHHIACRFPKPTDFPSIQPLTADFRPFLARLNFPRSIKEMAKQDLPQLSMHITSFNDATLVALTWPHTLMDAMGLQGLLKAWSLVLEGREAEVPPIFGAQTDVLLQVENDDETKQEDFVLERTRLKGFGLASFILRFLWDKFWNPKPELRTIFLPKTAFERLQLQTRQEVAEINKSSGGNLFVSEGDILTAWATRAVALSEPKSRPVTIGGLLNARPRIPRIANSDGIFAQNVLTTTNAFVSSDIAKGDLGPLALSHRQHLLEQSSQSQILHWLKAMRQEIRAGRGGLLLFGPSNALPILVNNLTKAELNKTVNFSAAVRRQGEPTESRHNPLGTTLMSYNQPLNRPLCWPNCFYMLGKDYDGNYWLMGSLTPQAWVKMKEELDKLKLEC